MPNKLKSENYPELTVVYMADIWRESDVWYPGRSRQRMETEELSYKTKPFNPMDDKKVGSVIRKFYDSYHYLYL